MRRRFAPQCNFRAIHSINPRFAARGAACRNNIMTGEKSEFHQAQRHIFRQVQPLEFRLVAKPQLIEGSVLRRRPLFDTQLHYALSMWRRAE